MSLTVVNTGASEADKAWGYRFGCDGTVDFEEAGRLLGGASERTIERRIADGKLRHGKDGKRVIICRRSVMDYLASCEK